MSVLTNFKTIAIHPWVIVLYHVLLFPVMIILPLHTNQFNVESTIYNLAFILLIVLFLVDIWAICYNLWKKKFMKALLFSFDTVLISIIIFATGIMMSLNYGQILDMY